MSDETEHLSKTLVFTLGVIINSDAENKQSIACRFRRRNNSSQRSRWTMATLVSASRPASNASIVTKPQATSPAPGGY
jgi:hypothetical protein